MKFEINITKFRFFVILSALVLVVASAFVVAYTTDGSGNPAVMGHSLDEVEFGYFSVEDFDYSANVGLDNAVLIGHSELDLLGSNEYALVQLGADETTLLGEDVSGMTSLNSPTKVKITVGNAEVASATSTGFEKLIVDGKLKLTGSVAEIEFDDGTILKTAGLTAESVVCVDAGDPAPPACNCGDGELISFGTPGCTAEIGDLSCTARLISTDYSGGGCCVCLS
jgi:hypothetical protein